jgi:putative tryptophan/tyrosine transport system substrate-binding protein
VSRLSRRQLVQGAGAVGLGLLAGCGRWPGQMAPAQIARIGFLAPVTLQPRYEAFQAGLRDLGYIDGQNVVFEFRSAEGHDERLPTLAAELVQLRVDVIVAGGTSAARAAQRASSTIPIVMALGDPVGTGLAASLGRPGGNVTGLTNLAPQLGAKRLELLKETLPGLARVAVLWRPDNPVKQAEWKETESAGQILGLQVQSLEVRAPEDFERAFAAATREHADGLIVFGDDLFAASRALQIVELAAQSHLPAMYESRVYLELGGFISYGPSISGLYQRAAYYVDKILKGAKPADLPIEQPMRFDFIINLRTAQALGLTVPPHVLLQATEVIQ